MFEKGHPQRFLCLFHNQTQSDWPKLMNNSHHLSVRLVYIHCAEHIFIGMVSKPKGLILRVAASHAGHSYLRAESRRARTYREGRGENTYGVFRLVFVRFRWDVGATIRVQCVKCHMTIALMRARTGRGENKYSVFRRGCLACV